ncbi:MAG: hypothetical protein ACI3T9_04450 [Romboutsia timonensis]
MIYTVFDKTLGMETICNTKEDVIAIIGQGSEWLETAQPGDKMIFGKYKVLCTKRTTTSVADLIAKHLWR